MLATEQVDKPAQTTWCQLDRSQPTGCQATGGDVERGGRHLALLALAGLVLPAAAVFGRRRRRACGSTMARDL